MAKTKVKTVYKIRWKNMAILLALVVVATTLIWGGNKFVRLFNDYNATKSIIEKISSEVEVTNVVDDENTKTIAPDSTLSKFDSYWNYIKLPLLEVDMASLKKINSQSIGYIEVKGTAFSYPVLQGDADFYKSHSFDKKENSFGWIYLSEENSTNSLDANTIIYANKVFGNVLSSNLKEIFKEEWSSNDDNYVIKYFTSDYSTLWQIVSVYKSKDEDYKKVSFDSEEEYEIYIDDILKRSEVKFKADVKTSDKLLTIATNSNGTNMIIQAKLIKIKEDLS